MFVIVQVHDDCGGVVRNINVRVGAALPYVRIGYSARLTKRQEKNCDEDIVRGVYDTTKKKGENNAIQKVP